MAGGLNEAATVTWESDLLLLRWPVLVLLLILPGAEDLVVYEPGPISQQIEGYVG